MTTNESVAAHPAPFTDTIIRELFDLICRYVPDGYGIHDPFGGEGTRLGALCDRLGYRFTATDLEVWKDHDPRVVQGDSTDPASYPDYAHAIVTSPTYCNGINDHFDPKDTSTRLTYRIRAGHELHPNNTGRYSGRGSRRDEAEYWRLTREVVKHWPDIALVNVKDSVRAGEVYPLVRLWSELLGEQGYAVESVSVACPGWRVGRNGQARVDDEAILLARRGDAL